MNASGCSLRRLLGLWLAVAAVGVYGQEGVGLSAAGQLLGHLAPRAGYPLSLVVELISREPSFAGELEAWTGDGVKSSRVRQSVRIGKGRFRFYLYPLVEENYPNQVTWRLLDSRGKPLTGEPLVLRSTALEADQVLAVLATQRQLRDGDLGQPPTADRRQRDLAVTTVRRLALFPDRWYGLAPFRAVFWDGSVTDELDPAQREALQRWVSTGGRLIMILQAGDRELHSPLPALFPTHKVTATPVARAGAAPAPGVIPPETFASPHFPGAAAARFSERSFGLGAVVLLPVDYHELPTWPANEISRLLGLASGHVTDEEYQGRTPMDDMKDPLAREAGYTSLSFAPILLLGLVYILAVSVGDYLLLRKLRRLPWTWVTFPGLIVVFSVLSYLWFYQGEAGVSIRHEIAFVDQRGAEGGGRQLVFGCVRHQSNHPVEFHSVPEQLVSPWAGTMAGANPSRSNATDTRILEADGGGALKTIAMPGVVNAFEWYHAVLPLPAQPPCFSTDLRSDGTRLSGIVTRESPEHLIDAFILYRGSWCPLPIHELGGGKRLVLDLLPRTNRGRGDFRLGQLDPSAENTLADHLRPWVFYSANQTGLDAWREGLDAYRGLQEDRKVAMIVGFYHRQFTEHGTAVRRLTCIRQVVPVATPGGAAAPEPPAAEEPPAKVDNGGNLFE